MRYNVLIFHLTGLSRPGSAEKLLRTIALQLDRARFNVHFMYGDKEVDQASLANIQQTVIAIPFDYKYRTAREPYQIVGMRPGLQEVIDKYNIHCVVLAIYADYLHSVVSLPSTLPVVAISPFGHYCSVGNVVKVYCSGKESLRRVKAAGAKDAEMFFNPLPPVLPEYEVKRPVGDTIIFGRTGRADDQIFDPISIKAFKLLEERYGDAVRYDLVNPPPAMVEMVRFLGLQRVRLLDYLDDSKLQRFYYEIDVFAHARRNGETLGVAIAEAMLAGSPVVTHKSHHYNEHLDLIDETCGRWCGPDDVEGYYHNMEWFVEHRERIREMGRLARLRVEPLFSLDKVMRKVSDDVELACSTCTYSNRGGHVLARLQSSYRQASLAIRWTVVRRLLAPVYSRLKYQFPIRRKIKKI